MVASVPEALKKKRVLYQAALAKRALAQQNAKKAGVLKRRAIIKRAAAYAKEYAQADRTLVTRMRQAKKNGNAYVAGEPKLALVIRIRGINQVSPIVTIDKQFQTQSNRFLPASRRSSSSCASAKSVTPPLSS